jgi:hypothetical protein
MMKLLNAPKIIAACAISTWATAAFSHDGHGAEGTHWHATDAWGFVALAVCVAAALWFSRGDE